MMTLIFPTQGNPIATKRTIESVRHICDDFVIGYCGVFRDDLDMIKSYRSEYPIKIVELPFDFIYKCGFAVTLNSLAAQAKNSLNLYLNVGEILESCEKNIRSTINEQYNCYYIDNSGENHRWFRVWDKTEMSWSGRIHEEVIGDHRPYHRPIFRFADTEKDMIDKFKAAVNNDIKEIVYWHNLMKIADDPDKHLGATSSGWVSFARDNYATMVDRLSKKGNRPEAFDTGNLEMYLKDIYTNPEFEKERFESNHIIEFQGDPKYLGK